MSVKCKDNLLQIAVWGVIRVHTVTLNVMCITVTAVTPTGAITSTTDPMFTLKCTTTGVPAFVTWTYSSASRMYTNDGGHQLSQSLLNGVTSTFESRLVFLSHPYPSDTGERVCIATATYISANSSETNSTTAVGKSALINLEPVLDHTCVCR